jgi:hypothetical protein
MINIKNSQEINQLMQPCNFKIQSITNLYIIIVRNQSADAALQCNINRDNTHRQIEGWSVDAAPFAKELAEIYSTPTPNTVAKGEKDHIDCVFIIIYNGRELVCIHIYELAGPCRVQIGVYL